MITALDYAVGEIVEAVESENIAGSTLIVFSSDNGGTNPGKLSDNGPLRGGKYTVYEGGVRVAAFATWPGKIKPGSSIQAPIHICDWYPTLVNLTGAPEEQKLAVDGMDILPLLTGEGSAPEREIILNAAPDEGAIRAGDWKLVIHKKRGPELYNLASDPSEKKDLSAQEPEKVKQLKARYDHHAAQAVPPKAGPDPAGFKSPAIWGEF